MKKLKKLSLTELANNETVNQVLSAQNLNDLRGGGYVSITGGPSGTIGAGISYTW
jgi:natural product precursor